MIDADQILRDIGTAGCRAYAGAFVRETGAPAEILEIDGTVEVLVRDPEWIESEFGTFALKPDAWVEHGVFAIGGRIG